MHLPPDVERKALELAGDQADGDRSNSAYAELLDLSEKQFQAEVLALARRHGWKCYHAHDSRKSAAGFPDLVLVRDRVIVAELKVGDNRLSADQVVWLEAFAAAGVEVHEWYPRDWPAIAATLATD
jgi:hypothetical protein